MFQAKFSKSVKHVQSKLIQKLFKLFINLNNQIYLSFTTWSGGARIIQVQFALSGYLGMPNSGSIVIGDLIIPGLVISPPHAVQKRQKSIIIYWVPLNLLNHLF